MYICLDLFGLTLKLWTFKKSSASGWTFFWDLNLKIAGLHKSGCISHSI
jgi:hypothetical protein